MSFENPCEKKESEKTCPQCNGRGFVDGKTCDRCNDHGTIAPVTK